MPWYEGVSSLDQPVPEEMFGELRDSTDLLQNRAALLGHLEEDGYLFLRGVLNQEDVLSARAEVFQWLSEVGEVKAPAIEGIATGTSCRQESFPDLGAFWKQVCEGLELRRVTHAGPMLAIMETVLGGKVRPFDFLWLRAMPPGRASAFHYDHVYMNRGTDHLYTVWTPLGRVPIEEGPILIMENSHRWDDVIAQFQGLDVDTDKSRPGHVTMAPVTYAVERGCRLLSADFEPGDLLIMQMFLLHGSLDNRSKVGRIRLSCDTRYQLASDLIDERWIGKNPLGHGQGYGGVGGSHPLTAAPIRR